eukprot:c17059_g2_i1 orf=2-598(-)
MADFIPEDNGRDDIPDCILQHHLNHTQKYAINKTMELLGSWNPKVIDWRICLFSVVITYVAVEQFRYLRKKKHLPGPWFVIPFFGNVLTMVGNPTKFWDDQALVAKKTGLSGNMLFGKFTVFVRDSEFSQKIFGNVSLNAFHLIGHPFGKKLFGKNNLIFMFGDEHKDLRRRLAPLFTLKALSVYVSIQEETIRRHLDK